MKFDSVQEICKGLNETATKTGFFELPPGTIEQQANHFVDEFAKSNELISHVITPFNWWFDSDKYGAYENYHISLYPLSTYIKKELHIIDENERVYFKTIKTATKST